MTSADSIAISLHFPIPIHKSLVESASESFIPSHTIATLYHFFCNSFIYFSLSCGSTEEKTFSSLIHTSFAI